MKSVPNLARVFLIIAAAIIGSTIVTYLYGSAVLHAHDKIVAQSEAIRTLDHLISAVKDAETGQRGYLLTGDEKYLAPYNGGVFRLSGQLGRLEAARIPKKPERLVFILNSLIEQKLSELKRTIEVRRSGRVEEALAIVKSDQGKGLMDKIRAVVTQLQVQQQAHYGEAVRMATRATYIRTIVFALTGLMNLLFLAWAYRLVALEIQRRREMQSEAERQRREAARHEETLRVTLACIGDCVIVTDTEGRITFMNAATEVTTGWTLAEARSLPAGRVFKIINESTREQVESPVDKVLESGNTVGLAKHTLLIRKDGSEVPIDDSGSTIRRPNGDIVGVVLVFRDFSTYRNTECEMKAAKEVAEEAGRVKDHFLAMLSHELRTPLTPVLTLLNLWGLTGAVPASLESDVRMVRRNVELECRLIDDLLDLTRVAKGKVSFQPTVINVHHLIQRVVDMFEDQVRTRNLDVSLQLNAAKPYVYADAARFQQVVWNIVKNATKYTRRDGKIRIASNNDHDGKILVVVSDSGIGMSSETLSRIFHPFDQGELDIFRHSGGLGLGMSLSKALLEMMGGSISATSDGVGQGSAFIVSIPSVESPTGSKPAEASGSDGVDNGSSNLKILLVEDHLDSAITMKRLLEMRGHDVHLAHSVAAAVETIANDEFELLLCDLGLPDGTGLDVIRYYRTLYQTPAIAVSGFGMESDVVRCMEAGFNSHVTKPVNFQKLEAAIRKVTEDKIFTTESTGLTEGGACVPGTADTLIPAKRVREDEPQWHRR